MGEFTNVIKVVAPVAGIGGVALTVFFFLFKDVIRKNIFPTLDATAAYKLIVIFMVLTSTVVLAALGIYAYMNTPSQNAIGAPKKVADLRVVDVGFIRGDKGRKTLDIKLMNNGDGVVFIKGARLAVVDRRKLRPLEHMGMVEVSYVGDVVLPERNEMPLSLNVKPNDTERFQIRLSSGNTDVFSDWLYILQLSIDFNEKSTLRVGDSLAVFVPVQAEAEAAMSGGDSGPHEGISQDAPYVQQALHIATYVDPEVKELARKYKVALSNIKVG